MNENNMGGNYKAIINNSMSTVLDQIKRWFTLKEAAKYSAIGKHRLVVMARIGKIKGFQDVDSGRHEWIFDRLSIDNYREAQMIGISAKEKALEIMRT